MGYFVLLCMMAGLLAAALNAEQVPADTALEIRLQQQVSSLASKPGSSIQGMLIAPVRCDGKTLIPTGVGVSGVLREVRRVGWGLVHETARLLIDFNELELLDGSHVPMKTRLVEVDNARETVDRQGRVKGIRSTGTWAHKTSSRLAGWAMFDPIAFVFTRISASWMLRFADPEILFPAGADLLVRLLEPIEVTPAPKGGLPGVTRNPEERERLERLVRDVPYRTRTLKADKPSDLANLLFIGSPDALERAFEAAGWVQADTFRASTAFRTIRSFTENQGYQNAPMSTLLVEGRAPEYSLSKTLNTFSKRHHARIWSRPETWDGAQILMASATRDVGIAFAPKARTLVHLINERIDNERAKVVNDLNLTGCVDATELIPRPWVPTETRNATGDRLITDGATAVVRLNSCETPLRGDALLAAAPPAPNVSTFKRGVRETSLTLRNDFVRGNLAWQAVAATQLAVRYFRGRSRAKPHPRTTDVDGDAYSAADLSRPGGSEIPPPQEPRPAASALVPQTGPPAVPSSHGSNRWEPAMFEIGVQGGPLQYPSHALDTVGFSVAPRTPDMRGVKFGLANLLAPGFAVGGSVTVNSFRYFSTEFTFTNQRGKYRFGTFLIGPDSRAPRFSEQSSGLMSRQFQYNLLVHLRPRETRLRPYFATGSVLQLIHLTNAPVKRSDGPFRYGLKNIGMVRAAYNLGGAPPLEGGGIFQLAFQYGAGIKYRIHPRWLVRLDFRETIGRQPNFFPAPIPAEQADGASVIVTRPKLTGAFRQQRLTAGFAFTF